MNKAVVVFSLPEPHPQDRISFGLIIETAKTLFTGIEGVTVHAAIQDAADSIISFLEMGKGTLEEDLENEFKFIEPLDLEGAVYQALGAASVCWTESPKGIFESDRAKVVGEKLLEYIEKVDRNARAYGWEIGHGDGIPPTETIDNMSPNNPFIEKVD